MRLTIKKSHWIDLSVLILALVIILFGIGDYGLYEPHEGHFAMVGEEMRLRGDWMTPHLNGAPYLNKPPLLYWLIALTMGIFSPSEFTARLPLVLFGWLGIVVTWKWSRDLWGIYASRVAALMLSVTLGWFIFTHQILLDVPLGTLLLISNYCLWRSLYDSKSYYWYGAYISLGLCLLTKGLIGIVFPLVGCLVLIAVRRDYKIIKRLSLFRGLLLVLAVVLPWLIAVEQANPGFLHYFIFNEHLDRLFDRRFPPDYEVSKISAVGYLGITAAWCFPWILFLPSVIKFNWQQWRQGFKLPVEIPQRQRSDGIFLLAIAFILPLIFFLPLSSRLIYYSIPAIPPYIILCGGWLNNNRSFNKLNLKIYGLIAIILGIIFCSAIAFQPLLSKLLPPIINTPKTSILINIVAIALGGGWILAGMMILRRSNFSWLPLVCALIITYIAVVRGFVLYQDLRSSKTLVNTVNAALNLDTLWTFEGSREIGAAGAIAYYLNQGKDYSLKDINNNLLPGWATGKQDTIYRTVMVLSDGGKNRLPPQFPGNPPQYLITKEQLQTYWDSDRPVVFVTDFLRQPNDPQDPLTLNLPRSATKPQLTIGTRQLYLNSIAQKQYNNSYTK
ncbi:MAG: glycosyltransferase family 39 protein [Pleurocapsa sp.]